MRKAWIYAIVSRRCMERVRRQRLSLEMITCMVGGTEGSTSGVASGRRPAAWASHALTKLPSCSCREQSTFWSKSKCSGAERQTLDEVIPCDTYFLRWKTLKTRWSRCHTVPHSSIQQGCEECCCWLPARHVPIWALSGEHVRSHVLSKTSSHFKPLQAASIFKVKLLQATSIHQEMDSAQVLPNGLSATYISLWQERHRHGMQLVSSSNQRIYTIWF